MALMGKTEPRVYTPPLRELTPETSLGFAVCDFSRTILNIEPLPWQEWLLIHALEIVGPIDGDWRFRFRKVVVMVARQNGKTYLSVVLAAFFMFVLMVANVLGTSANLDKAEEVWFSLLRMIVGDDEADVPPNPVLLAEFSHKKLGNGKLAMWLKHGQRYKVAAVSGMASTKGGRGDSNDLVLLDELREHRSWNAWSATTKSTNARPRGLTWAMTNAGTVESVVLRSLRVKAHQRLGDPDGIVAKLGDLMAPLPDGEAVDDTVGWFEWSAAPGCDVYDREAWAQANPSLGYGFLEERTIASDAQSDDEVEFRTEVLCQFVESVAEPAFPGSSWLMGTDEASEPAKTAPAFFGVDLSADRTTTSIAACAIRADGRWHVEVVARDLGTDWALRWFADRADPLKPLDVAWQKNGAPISALGDQLKAIPGLIPHELAGAALAQGFDRFWAGIAACDPNTHQDATRIMHRPQPVLDEAARIVAIKTKGDGGRLMDRKASPGDVSPLVACVMAHAVATTPVEEEPPKVAPSAYADGHDLLVI